MTRRIILACVLVAFVATGLKAQGRVRWELLGEKNVTDRLERDTLAVTRVKGTFSAIKIEVKRRAVNFERVVIHFGNGADQVVEMRDSIRAGGETRAIDIDGNNRIIRSIEFWYDAKSLGRSRAEIRVLGRR